MVKKGDRPVFHPALGAYFQELREARKLASLRMAARVATEQRLDVGFNELQRLEAGRTLNPDPQLIRDLAALYRRPYEELVAKLVEARFGTTISAIAGAVGGTPVGPAPLEIDGHDFGAVPLMKGRIAAGSPLAIDDHESAGALAFSATFLRRWKAPVCVRVGPREESMLPVIAPGDVVLLERAGEGRPPDPTGIYAVRVDDGSTLKRVQLIEQDGRAWLALMSENADKRKYGVRMVPVSDGDRWQEYLVGRVVWHGQYV